MEFTRGRSTAKRTVIITYSTEIGSRTYSTEIGSRRLQATAANGIKEGLQPGMPRFQ